ncbi:MFS transporter [Actinomycetospora chibensis]|uniref:MFS transporter n=1 Tax=Actinomycetospora chibensis TaxID=663606 RepID=A0ABV9RFS0_9PSEU|nr:MFS transporter [Actinomycetospora chibensis]MDD7923015.1 MFS transporter [Actinomycetospora chibensis]
MNADAVYRRITRRLVPFLFVCYAAAYLDRVNVGFAKLQLQDDLQFSDTVYGLGAGIFFVGYILFEVPSNVVLHRIGAKWWIARIMVTWALISGAMAFINSATMFYILRFLLGVAEAGFIPGILLYLTYWFPAQRRGRVTAIFLAAIPVATIVGGPLSGWILTAFDEVGGLGGWQWMFLIEAVPSLVLGLLVLRYLDNSVDAARWLSNAEKDVVRADLAAEEASREGGHGSIRAAMTSGRVWLLCGIYFTIALGIYLVSFWLPTIIKGSGVADPLTIGLLTAVPYVVAVIAMITWSAHGDRTGERRWHTTVPCLITGLGLVLTAVFLQSTALAVGAMVLVAAGVSTAQAAFWSIPSALLTGAGAAAGIALVNSIGNIGGAVATSLVGWLSDLTGSPASSLYTFGVVLVVGGVLVLALPRSVDDRPMVVDEGADLGSGR